MSINLYFSKITLPQAKDFPVIQNFNMQPYSLTYQGRSNRLWLVMCQVKPNQHGNAQYMHPFYPFYSDNNGESWEIYHHGAATTGCFKYIKSAADGTTLAFDQFRNQTSVYRMIEQPDHTVDFNLIETLDGIDHVALGGDNLIYTYTKYNYFKEYVHELCHYLGENQSKAMCNTVKGHALIINHMDVGSDGSIYALVSSIPGQSNLLCHIVNNGEKWVVQTTSASIQMEKVVAASSAQVFVVPHDSAGQMYGYGCDDNYFETKLHQVEKSGKTHEPPLTGSVPGDILNVTAIEPGKMCLVTAVNNWKTNGNKKGPEFTNSAYIQVPEPIS